MATRTLIAIKQRKDPRDWMLSGILDMIGFAVPFDPGRSAYLGHSFALGRFVFRGFIWATLKGHTVMVTVSVLSWSRRI
jgi:hypothetical protein